MTQNTPPRSNQNSLFGTRQKFIVGQLLFLFSLLVVMYYMLQAQNRLIDIYEKEAVSIQYQRQIRKLLEKLPEHELQVNRYLKGNSSVKNEILNLQTLINGDMKALQNIDKNLEEVLQTSTKDLRLNELPNLKPKEIEDRWNEISRDIFSIDIETNLINHNKLITQLRQLSKYVGETSFLSQDLNIDTSNLISVMLMYFPEMQVVIPQLISVGEGVIDSEELTSEERSSIIRLMSILTYNVLKSKEALDRAFTVRKKMDNDDEIKAKLEEPMKEFSLAAQNFLSYIENNILNAQKISGRTTEFLSLGSTLLRESYVLWDSTSLQIERIIDERIGELKRERLIAILLSSLIALLGFTFRYVYNKEINQHIAQLISTSKALAAGNLSVRILESDNAEFREVEQAFNQMADSFEELIGQLQRAGIQLTASTTQIAAAAKEQEATVIEQEATTKEIAATAKEISATAKDFAKTMNEVSLAAEQTTALAVSGKTSLATMEQIMQQMVEASGNIASKLAVLNEKAGTITNVITTITKVADQTNLLSLNAAIEAEKAGEHGRSFSVIAREIRRLADQTANATLDIEKMVNEMVSAVSAGVMGVDKFSEEIRTGVQQVEQVSDQLSKIIEQFQAQTASFESVNQGMQSQSLGAEQINDSITQLSEAAQQTAESIRQFHKAIEQLNQSAKEMQATAAKVKR